MVTLDRIKLAPATKKDRCDVIEFNHRFDEFNNHCYDQFIFWEWHEPLHRHVAIGFVLDSSKIRLERAGSSCSLSIMNEPGGQHVAKTMVAKSYRETWTNYDPEGRSKEVFPERFRRGLWK